MKLIDNKEFKAVRSEDYNFNFRKSDGFFQRWGATVNDDPEYSPFGPEILDIEISDGGTCPQKCAFCYKGNSAGGEGRNMTLDTFKKILAKMPKTITQIAFGITSISANPDLFNIFRCCRSNSIIPNVTISSGDNLTDEQIETLVKLCGAMAFSVYGHVAKDKRYSLIGRFIKAGLKQCNIHFMISKQTHKFAYEVCNDIQNHPDLKGLNAIVFLGLKPKNRGQAFDVLPTEEFVELVKHCLANNIRFGFDSCSAPRFDKSLEYVDLEDAVRKNLQNCSERCESGLFSAYIDVNGKYWQCSFGEDLPVSYGIDLTTDTVKNFVDDVWNSEKMKEWRNLLLGLERQCPLYPEIRV